MTHIQSYTEVDAENSPGVGGGLTNEQNTTLVSISDRSSVKCHIM